MELNQLKKIKLLTNELAKDKKYLKAIGPLSYSVI